MPILVQLESSFFSMSNVRWHLHWPGRFTWGRGHNSIIELSKCLRGKNFPIVALSVKTGKENTAADFRCPDDSKKEQPSIVLRLYAIIISSCKTAKKVWQHFLANRVAKEKRDCKNLTMHWKQSWMTHLGWETLWTSAQILWLLSIERQKVLQVPWNSSLRSQDSKKVCV